MRHPSFRPDPLLKYQWRQYSDGLRENISALSQHLRWQHVWASGAVLFKSLDYLCCTLFWWHWLLELYVFVLYDVGIPILCCRDKRVLCCEGFGKTDLRSPQNRKPNCQNQTSERVCSKFWASCLAAASTSPTTLCSREVSRGVALHT